MIFYNRFMGRAQGRAADLFSSVFGEVRGLRGDQEGLSTAPGAYRKTVFAHGSDPADGYRRMGLADWMLEAEYSDTLTTDAQNAFRSSGCYESGLPESEPEVALCHADLEELVQQKICIKRNNDVFGGSPLFGIRPLVDWPEEHQKAFSAWCKDGRK
jgi:hypothetical protein